MNAPCALAVSKLLFPETEQSKIKKISDVDMGEGYYFYCTYFLISDTVPLVLKGIVNIECNNCSEYTVWVILRVESEKGLSLYK